MFSVSSLSRKVKIAAVPTFVATAFSLGTFGLHEIDARTMAAQIPAKCEKGQWHIAVPRTHIHAPMMGDNGFGPALAQLMVNHPEFSINSILAANRDLTLKPSSLLPAVSGGVICLNLPSADKAQNAAAIIHTATAPGKVKLDLSFSLPKVLTDTEIVSVHYAAGFRGQRLIIMSAIAMAESSGRTNAVCRNNGRNCGASPATQLSADLGLDQINDKAWHVNERDMFNPLKSAKEAKMISDAHHGFRDWVTYQHGHHAKYIKRMWNAAKRIGTI